MSGAVIRVLEQTHYVFTGLVSGTQAVTVAQHIDTSYFREGRLIVRVVKARMEDTNDDIQIFVDADPWEPSFGTTLFVTQGTAAALLPDGPQSLNPNGSGVAPPSDPYAMFFNLDSNFGPMIQVGLAATRGASPSGALEIELLVDLALKD